jgi:hypothetical protein
MQRPDSIAIVRRCLALLPLLFSIGCATDYEKGQWAEVRKDLRGDNMKMGSAAHSGPMTAGLP